MSDQAAGGGRTRITARALEHVTAAVAAEAFGDSAGRIRVAITDTDGALDLALETVIRTVSLTRAAEEPAALERIGGSILQRAASAETTIRDRVHELTGSTVRRVAVHVTGVTTPQERRVR